MDWIETVREIRSKNQEESKNMSVQEKIRFENECRDKFLEEIKKRKIKKEELAEA